MGALFLFNVAVVTYWQITFHLDGKFQSIFEWTGAHWGRYIGFTIGQLLITFIAPLFLAII